MLTTQVSNRKAEAGESLTAQEYELRPFGVECRIMRSCRRDPADGVSYDETPWTWEWTAHVDRGIAFSVTWDGDGSGPSGWQPDQRYVVKGAAFPFDPDVAGDEADALERARRYCVDVAHEVVGLRPALEGLVARVERVIADAVREHRAVPTKMY